MIAQYVCWLLVLLLRFTSAAIVSNGLPRVDTASHLMDAHDGQIVQWADGRYYWYGMGYGDCQVDKTGEQCAGVTEPFSSEPCGFQTTHKINIYSSADLVAWRFEGEALPYNARPLGVYFRPKVVFNPSSGKYVLWVNFLSAANPSDPVYKGYPTAKYIVARANSPVGPWDANTERIEPTMAYGGPGDFDILVTGNDAYIAYTSYGSNHKMAIEKLNADFTDAASPHVVRDFADTQTEAPALFMYQGDFYLTFGQTCCFCYGGSGVHMYYASGLDPANPTPLGTWYDLYEIGLLGPKLSLVRAQQSFVFKYGTDTLIWAGDQWGITPDGTKGHVLQYWVPLEWTPRQQIGYPSLPQPLRAVYQFDPDNVPAMVNWGYGWCSSEDLALVATDFASLPAGCQMCLGINSQRGITDNAELLALCSPLGKSSTNAACGATEVAVILQLLQLCPDLATCPLAQAMLLLGTLPDTCKSCVMVNFEHPENITTNCLAEVDRPAGACSVVDLSWMMQMIQLCTVNGVILCPAEVQVQLGQLMGHLSDSCRHCAMGHWQTPSVILPVCVPLAFQPAMANPCYGVTCAAGGICSWGSGQCLCATPASGCGGCGAHDAPVLLELQDLCAGAGGCPSNQTDLLLGTLRPACQACATANRAQPGDLFAHCVVNIPERPVDACSQPDAYALQLVLSTCAVGGAWQCASNSLQPLSASCRSCVTAHTSTPDLIFPLCVLPQRWPFGANLCFATECSGGGVCSWATGACLCPDPNVPCERTVCYAREFALQTAQKAQLGSLVVAVNGQQLSLAYAMGSGMTALEGAAYAGLKPVPTLPNGQVKTGGFPLHQAATKKSPLKMGGSLASLGITCSGNEVRDINVAAYVRAQSSAPKTGALEAWALQSTFPQTISTKDWPTFFHYRFRCGCALADVGRDAATDSESDPAATDAPFPWVWLSLLAVPVVVAGMAIGAWLHFRARNQSMQAMEATIMPPEFYPAPNSPAPTANELASPLLSSPGAQETV